MKKLILSIISMLIITILGGCNSTKLADSFDKATVESSAKQVIEYMNSGEYDSINAMVREDIKDALSSELLSTNADKVFSEIGSFVEYKDMNIIGRKDKDEDYAVALVQVKYEKRNLLYTISFDSNMELVGFYMK
jgi:hypothetical protein